MISPRPPWSCLLVAIAFAPWWQAAVRVQYRPSNGIDAPVLKTEVKPNYTKKAIDAKIEGSIWLECLVTPKGQCSDIKVVRSLDSKCGLDKQAIKAAHKWRFIPAKKQNQPVPALVTIYMYFTLPK